MTKCDDKPTMPANAQAQLPLGNVRIGPEARKALTTEDIQLALSRHANGEWGNVSKRDAKENERALREGVRVMSTYRSNGGVKFWVVTKSDRSETAVFLPHEV